MSDPIQKVHLLFTECFGQNMREWPENVGNLRNAITKHLSDEIKWAKNSAYNSAQQNMLNEFKDFLDIKGLPY